MYNKQESLGSLQMDGGCIFFSMKSCLYVTAHVCLLIFTLALLCSIYLYYTEIFYLLLDYSGQIRGNI